MKILGYACKSLKSPLRVYHIPSWGPCVCDHMVKFASCNVQKKGTLLNYHNFHPDFSVWIDPWENKNHQQVEVGETIIIYIYYKCVHGVPLFCDFRSTHFYRSLPQPAPVSKTPNTLASRKWPPWMIQPWGCLRRRDFFWDLNGTMLAPPVMFVV